MFELKSDFLENTTINYPINDQFTCTCCFTLNKSMFLRLECTNSCFTENSAKRQPTYRQSTIGAASDCPASVANGSPSPALLAPSSNTLHSCCKTLSGLIRAISSPLSSSSSFFGISALSTDSLPPPPHCYCPPSVDPRWRSRSLRFPWTNREISHKTSKSHRNSPLSAVSRAAAVYRPHSADFCPFPRRESHLFTVGE